MPATWINSEEEFLMTMGFGKAVVIFFCENGSEPDNTLGPFFDAMSDKPIFTGGVSLCKVDVKAVPALAPAGPTPGFALFKDGHRAFESTALQPQAIMDLIEQGRMLMA
ncbi:hypothetical protein FS837_007846 [Tulasnella sp. UAMH 9824]|nr:hypothetical protein FS837_007846 [Tulasnella sp. UAMH 9824]